MTSRNYHANGSLEETQNRDRFETEICQNFGNPDNSCLFDRNDMPFDRVDI